jgi:hypothetical protein
MNDEPCSETSPTAPDGDSPAKRPADPMPGQPEEAPDGKRSWWRAVRARVGRFLPRRPPEPEDSLTSPLPGIVLFLCLLGVAVLSIYLIRPPAPLPVSASADQYSAARALTHIRALASRPRPVGTQAHAEAQMYLVAQLQRLGLEPQVQTTVGLNPMNLKDVTHVENVLARLSGSRSGGKAVLLVAHYDSPPSIPAAADDASGCATLLETARALTAGGRPLANDVIFLFSDGEEVGCMGSEAFVREHPWAKDVGVVVNLDPAGQMGPNLLTDVSPDDDWLISQVAQAGSDPLANSLAPEVYRRSGSGNDFTTVFRAAGYPGVEIGCVSYGYYHTALDGPALVHRDSLQHQGSIALSLARRFGDLDLTAAHRGSAVYFNALGNRLLIHYPQSWAIPLVVLAALVWVGALVFGLRWKQVSWRGLLLGTLAALLVVVVIAAVIDDLAGRLVLAIYPQYRMDAYTYNILYYWLASLALGVGLGALLHLGLRTRIRTAELALGGLLLWLALAVGFPLWMPGASWALTWPLVFSCIGLWGWFALRRHASARMWGIVWLAFWAVPAVALVALVLYPGSDTLPSELVVGLLVGLLAPHLAIMARPRKWWLPALMGVVVVVVLVAGHLTSTYSPTRPLQDGVAYALSADTGKAYWVSWSGPDRWTGQFIQETDAGGDCTGIWPEFPSSYRAPAPLADLPTPAVQVLPTTASGIYRLRIVPAPGTWSVYVCTLPKATPVTYYVNAKPLKSDGWTAYWAPPAEGYNLSVKMPGPRHSLKLRVMAQTLGLPAIPGFTYAARPDWIVPSGDYWANSTWVAKTVSLAKE